MNEIFIEGISPLNWVILSIALVFHYITFYLAVSGKHIKHKWVFWIYAIPYSVFLVLLIICLKFFYEKITSINFKRLIDIYKNMK